ncbi:Uncharacterised protein [uncultured archaeon]|nr:Uncharacterised protein [uncultured archaeon]
MIALRYLFQDRFDCVNIRDVYGYLQIRRVPEPYNFESHYGVHGPVFLVHDGLCIRESLHGSLDGKLCGAVIVTVYLVVVLCCRMDE